MGRKKKLVNNTDIPQYAIERLLCRMAYSSEFLPLTLGERTL